jgi:hypothetical protein
MVSDLVLSGPVRTESSHNSWLKTSRNPNDPSPQIILAISLQSPNSLDMKRPAPSSDPLPNSRHEAFAREVASGKNATQAYRNAYGTENRRVASTGGHRLTRRKSIAARIRAIQQAGARTAALDLQEIHDFLTRVVRTPAGQILPSSDLCTRVKHTRDGATDVWMPNKLACLRLSAKLQGFLDTAQTNSQLSTLNPQPPPILTEELREIVMAQRSAALREYDEEQRLAKEERSVAENHPAPEKPRVAEKPSAEEQTPTEQKRPAEVLPARSGQPTQLAPSGQPNPSGNPAHLAWAAYPISRNSAARPAPTVQPPPPIHPASFPPHSHQHSPRFSRVTPRASSEIVII